jgi:TRAP-type transport system periplasmic protein
MKRCCALALCVLVALGLLGGVSAEAAKYTIKVANAGPNNPDNRTVMAVDMFKRMVESQTKGDIEVRPFHASSLGNEREALEGVKIGTVEMATLSSGPVPGFFAPVMVFSIPYLFSSAPLAWDVFNGPFGREFGEAMRKQTGIRILSITENGFRNFTNNTRPLRKPEDLKGLKLRTMENPAHMAMVKAFGADPTPIAFGELYMALQQKVVDGQETPVVLIHDMKFYEVQKYAILDGHVYDPLFVFMSDKFFSGLPAAYQNIVMDNAQLLATAHNGFSQRQNILGIEQLKQKGMDVYIPGLDELEGFKRLAQPAALKFVEEKAGKEWVTKILKAVGDSEQHLRVKK